MDEFHPIATNYNTSTIIYIYIYINGCQPWPLSQKNLMNFRLKVKVVIKTLWKCLKEKWLERKEKVHQVAFTCQCR